MWRGRVGVFEAVYVLAGRVDPLTPRQRPIYGEKRTILDLVLFIKLQKP